jgi:hypothetical protein
MLLLVFAHDTKQQSTLYSTLTTIDFHVMDFQLQILSATLPTIDLFLSDLPLVHSSSRPGTPAARMRPHVPSAVKKERSRQLSVLVDGFTSSSSRLVGSRQLVDVVEVAADGHHLVGHTDNYTQVQREWGAELGVADIASVEGRLYEGHHRPHGQDTAAFELRRTAVPKGTTD